MQQRNTFNIAIVGHVANGKTTITHCLSGINTKRHAEEQKSGRTIKLGYANLTLFKCNDCNTKYSTSQDVKKHSCGECGEDCKKAYFVSLCDTPGHSSFVKTMVRGSATVDGAIILTCPKDFKSQVQTLQHLAILEILNVRNVFIIQNKCDLVTKDECLTNYGLIREEFKGTVAETCPIIPCCAQRGLGVEKIIDCLFDMCDKLTVSASSTQPPKFNVFQIIRSFDINRPDTDIDHLRGGVIGGTLNGGELHVGDDIEIRPGLITKDNKYRALKTKILSIYSESTPIKQCSTGGLVALGTRLDPTLTRGDRMVGQVCGKFGSDIPPVVTTNVIKVFYMVPSSSSSSKKNRLTENIFYYFLWANVNVKGKVHQHSPSLPDSKHVFKITYEQPICICAHRCIIYDVSNTLIGFGQLIE